MTNDKKIELPKPQGHHCFACGTTNPIGLNMEFYRKGEFICSDITLGRDYEGWESVAHGGIISTLLDEVMSWTILHAKKVFVVTRKMNIKYVRNTMIGTPLTICGKLLDDSQPPKIKVKAEVRDQEGRLFVRSTAEFVEVAEADLTTVPEGMKREMRSLFEKFDQSGKGVE